MNISIEVLDPDEFQPYLATIPSCSLPMPEAVLRAAEGK
jgi:hypothetical protein